MRYAIYEKRNSNAKALAVKIKNNLKEEELNPDDPEVVIVVGGDGTFLRTVKRYIDKLDKILFVVFKAGNLGYYSQFDERHAPYIEEIIHSNKFYLNTFNILEFSINDRFKEHAINEIAISSTQSLSKFQILIDDVLLENFSGNGLCISTNNGSTGLNKSLNGAILDWNLSAIQIAEIAGVDSRIYHSLRNPLVLDGKRKITIINKTTFNKDKFINFDHESKLFKNFEKMEIKLSSLKVKSISSIENGFVEKIKESFNL